MDRVFEKDRSQMGSIYDRYIKKYTYIYSLIDFTFMQSELSVHKLMVTTQFKRFVFIHSISMLR